MLHVHVIDELRTGGAQTHLITMLREAITFPGIEHHVVSLFGDGELSGEIRSLGVQVHVLDLRPYFRKRKFLTATAEVQKLIDMLQPDLVEAHLTWSRFIALFAAWRAGVPLRIGFEQGDLYMNSWKFRIANFVAQSFAHRIVVCSEALGDWARHTHGIFRSKLLVLHNCVDLTRFNPEGPVARDVQPVAGTILFCAVGTLGRGVNKRMDVCIRALASARSEGANVALVICGDGEQRSELEKLATCLGVARQVKFLGTRPDVPAVLRACDVFCHAAPWEPFGIVAIEAMAVGLPIVVPDSGGIREIVGQGDGGLLYPALDHQALGQAMVRLAEDHSLRKSMGAAGRRIVKERFSVQQYLPRLYGVYGISVALSSAAMAGNNL
ncbi:MAG TPA: glycosyltransferase family 4 protein [Terriglobales bacterium]|nr:glycosyltransferase family 4 protein [Terriglobales bacterium]